MRRLRFAVVSSLAIAASPVFVPSIAAKPPTLSGFFPPGAERGRTATVKMSGSFERWPVQCHVEGVGVWAEAAEEKGTLSILVAQDARPGVRWIRVFDAEGASSLRPFLVGSLPETTEEEPNDDPQAPQKVPVPRVTINGRLGKRGDVDGFAVDLKAGRTLTVDLEAARRLGSPMDGVLQIVSSQGFVLVQNDDLGGLDPRIVFTPTSDGTYIVRLFAFPATPDSSISFAGGESYVYRLTLTTDGFLDHAFPLAAPREGAEVEAMGPNIERVGLTVSSGEGSDRVAVSHPSLAGLAEVRRVSGPVSTEVEPNGPDAAQPLVDLATVCGRIDPEGDRDAYRVTLKKGEVRSFRLESRAFGLPLDAVLTVYDAEGKSLADADDAGASKDPELKFTAPADGEYRIVVRDLHGRGGPRFAYLLTAVRPEPDFSLSLPSDVFEVVAGQESKIAVAVSRNDGFAEEIAITAEGLPDGVEASAATSKPGDDSAKSVTLVVRAPAPVPPVPFRVIGRAVASDGPARTARAKITGHEAETDHPWLGVSPSPKP